MEKFHPSCNTPEIRDAGLPDGHSMYNTIVHIRPKGRLVSLIPGDLIIKASVGTKLV